jgi:xanthine/uracil permease
MTTPYISRSQSKLLTSASLLLGATIGYATSIPTETVAAHPGIASVLFQFEQKHAVIFDIAGLLLITIRLLRGNLEVT